ncbi:hypothetical protein GCM10011430_14720 [Oxalicibacterium solurbis]|uniref:4'-phosphopantetheinyl transferase superfamily protein n=2 Tax=Oxalicibacterium solurbis TaxID=69280 RepID=A0A8J3F616_9BURK|nr:4'-phosphopantetheinyl transferase superfamily protein [Oxalicibacterium solurbis]GGI54298.1 hypothetical protein GCM10011430_14720 [Oxalicibacterium solurbis]
MNWLGPEELARHATFMRPRRQRQFLIGRILLRFAAGRLLGVDPASIMLTERKNDAPFLRNVPSSLGYSVSHSGPWVACAVSRKVALGLDVEMRDASRDVMALAEAVFDTDECALLNAKEGMLQITAFYERWSMREAAFKLAARGYQDGRHFSFFPHPKISMVLCSAQPLDETFFHDCTEEEGDGPFSVQ